MSCVSVYSTPLTPSPGQLVCGLKSLQRSQRAWNERYCKHRKYHCCHIFSTLIFTDFTYAKIMPYPYLELDVQCGHSSYIFFFQRVSRKMYQNTLKSAYIFRTDYWFGYTLFWSPLRKSKTDIKKKPVKIDPFPVFQIQHFKPYTLSETSVMYLPNLLL